MTTLGQAAEEYVGFLKARGLAKATITSQRNMLSHAETAWGADLELGDLHPRHIDRFFTGREWSVGTRNIYLLALRGFLKWCRTHRYLPTDYDPTEGWSTGKMPQTERTWLTLPVLQTLLDATEHARDRAFIAVGIYTFLRASEIVNLRIRDIDSERSELRVYRIKTQQNDRLPICAELQVELRAWLHYYADEHGELDPDWYLIPSRGPQPMKGVPGERRLIPTGEPNPLRPTRHVARPQRIVKEAMTRIGVGKHGDACHVLRRSGARALYETLRDMGHDGAARRVQSMLGHSSLTMTEKYLGLDHERMQRNEALAGKPMFGEPTTAIGRGHLRAVESA
ncbi:MAG TPA: site-specific integrase [Acidimicrobiia bacterium]